jgi:hypothetical protein
MLGDTQRGIKEGLGFGIVAGVVFGVVEMAGAAMMGDSPLMPLRMFASVVLGEPALTSPDIGTVVGIGTVAHLVLSAIFGLVYGLFAANTSLETQTGWGRQAVLGLLFGVVLWFANFQIIARVLYPWFLQAPQFLQMAMHAMFFGLPLSLMYARAERHVHHIGAHATA